MKDFVYLILTLEVFIELNEECSRANLRISLGLSERGSFDSIRTSVVRLAYPKSGMFFMHWIYRHCCRLQIQVYNLFLESIFLQFLVYWIGSLLGIPAFLGYLLGVIFFLSITIIVLFISLCGK